MKSSARRALENAIRETAKIGGFFSATDLKAIAAYMPAPNPCPQRGDICVWPRCDCPGENG